MGENEQTWSMNDLSSFLDTLSNNTDTESDTVDTQVETPVADTAVDTQVETQVETPATPETPTYNNDPALQQQLEQMQNVLHKMAQASNIQYTDDSDLLNKFNDGAIEGLAKQQGVPAELLKRMEMLEAHNAQYEAQQLQNKLTNDFKNLQAKYNLDNAAMQNFVGQIGGLDPKTVDIEKEYISRNLDSIIAARVQAGIQAALTKDAQVTEHATGTIIPGTGSTDVGAGEVKTVNDMRALLSNISNYK